jgi:drug/metabolite transporter (DMT)-like permease
VRLWRHDRRRSAGRAAQPVWATILGFAIWGDVPTPALLAGSAIVVASGLYILWRETLRRTRSPLVKSAPGVPRGRAR